MTYLSQLIEKNKILNVLSRHPGLCNNGFQFRDRAKLIPRDGGELLKARAYLVSDRGRDEVLTVIAYINVHGAPKPTDGTSYTLKHQAERWGQTVGLAGYTSNGAAIVAAVLVGYEVVIRPNDPNCLFKADPSVILLGPDSAQDVIDIESLLREIEKCQ